jgi:hypothetical protein
VASFEEAIRLARETGYRDAEAVCMHNLASIHLHTGDVVTALGIYNEVLAISRSAGNPPARRPRCIGWGIPTGT